MAEQDREEREVAREIRPETADFPIVGIGSSAGGLEALIE